jgi:hypothetical protein
VRDPLDLWRRAVPDPADDGPELDDLPPLDDLRAFDDFLGVEDLLLLDVFRAVEDFAAADGDLAGLADFVAFCTARVAPTAGDVAFAAARDPRTRSCAAVIVSPARPSRSVTPPMRPVRFPTTPVTRPMSLRIVATSPLRHAPAPAATADAAPTPAAPVFPILAQSVWALPTLMPNTLRFFVKRRGTRVM